MGKPVYLTALKERSKDKRHGQTNKRNKYNSSLIHIWECTLCIWGDGTEIKNFVI